MLLLLLLLFCRWHHLGVSSGHYRRGALVGGARDGEALVVADLALREGIES